MKTREIQRKKTAKKLVLQVKPPENFVGNIYSHVRKYVQCLSDEDKEKVDEARRQISHFWYRAARLTDIGILDSREIFESVGPPDILEILEPLASKRTGFTSQAKYPYYQPP